MHLVYAFVLAGVAQGYGKKVFLPVYQQPVPVNPAPVYECYVVVQNKGIHRIHQL